MVTKTQVKTALVAVLAIAVINRFPQGKAMLGGESKVFGIF